MKKYKRRHDCTCVAGNERTRRRDCIGAHVACFLQAESTPFINFYEYPYACPIFKSLLDDDLTGCVA